MVIMVFTSFIMSIFIGIQDPIIQKFAIRIAGGYISQKTGSDVQIGRLYISPNFTIHIDQFLVKDLQGSTLLGVDELKVRPIMEDLIKGDIHVGRVELSGAEANLITYQDSTHMNFQFLIDAFAGGDKEKSGESTPIAIDRILLRNLRFSLWNQNQDDPEKTANHLIDYSHMVVDSINLDLEHLLIDGSSITATIHHLAASEASGFRLNDMATQVNVSPNGILLDDLYLKTKNSNLHLDLHMLFDSFSAISSFVDSVRFDTKIYPTDIMLSDLGPFSSILYEMPDLLHLEGIMKGPVRNFTVNQLKLDLGQQTHFEGDIALQPLNLNNHMQLLNIKRMDYDIADLAAFHIPTATKTIPIPDALLPLGQGTIKGQFNGSFNKFKTNLELTSEIGDVSVSLDRFVNEQQHSVFEGYLEGSRVNVGVLANTPDKVGPLDLKASVIARQDRKGGMDIDIDGEITDAQLLGTRIDELLLNGNLHNKSFNGKINVNDNDLGLNFIGRLDFSNSKALAGDFKADIIHADLHKFNLVKEDTATLRATITADVRSINDFNNAEGTLNITDFLFTKGNDDLTLQHFDASITNDNLMQKRIDINCDFLDFQMAGQMDFATIGTAFKQYVSHYVTFPQWTEGLERFEKSGKSADQDFIVNLTIKNPKPLTRFFIPSVNIAKNTTLNGTFTTKSQSLNMTLRSKYVSVNNIKINDIECKNRSNNWFSNLRLNIDEVILRDSTERDSTRISLDALNLTARLQNDSIKTTIDWDDISLDDHNKANIQASFIPMLNGGRISVSKADILLNDFLWNIAPDNFVVIDGDRTQISNLELRSERQSLLVDGYAPMQAGDTLSVSLNQFDLATLSFLFSGMGFGLNGLISGDATLSNLKNSPTLFADLGIRDLGIDGSTYGDAKILSRWDNGRKAIDMEVGLADHEHRVLDVRGSYYTAKKTDNLDFSIDLDSLKLSILSPFLAGVVDRLQGLCYGNATVKGSLKAPEILGKLRVENGGCKVNYLNTFYTFKPVIHLTEDRIAFNNFTLVDTLGNAALVTGHITHQHLKDMALHIKLYPSNFLAMATTANLSPSFYGTAIATGIVEASGPTNDLRLSIKAITSKGTAMTIPLGGSSTVKQHEFITFVDKNQPSDEEEETAVVEPPKKSNSFSINLDLAVNNNAQVKIALPNGLGSMEAKGEGNIKLGLPANNPMSLIGDYNINSGSLSLNIQDVLKRNFSLEPGSTISWTGDPVNGTINATGVYQTKAALSSLGLADSTSSAANSIKVDCLVHLKNKLLNPDITFGLRLPNASEDLKQAVFYVVDTTNQAEMLLQSVYLMVFNSFNYGSSSGSEYYGFITNELNDIISQVVNDIDINVNYRPGSESTAEEMTVAMRKQLFDDRLTIETNFGVVRPNNNYANNSTNIVGDFNLDYKFTKDGRLSGQVFNRSNYNTNYYQYTFYKMAPYTQGIGITYSKNFDSFRDLFKKRTNTLNLPNRPMVERPRPNRNQTNNDEQPPK